MTKMFLSILPSQMILYKTNMTLLLMIICTSLMLSFSSFLNSLNHWMLILILLVYISGVMVLFMFVVSLTPNEKNKTKKWTKMIIFLLTSLMMMMEMKILMKSEFKMNSSYKNNLTFMILMVMMMMMSAYMPPKMMMMIYSGMKSSK